MTHELISKARQRRERAEAERKRHEAFDARCQEAYDELDHRHHLVGFSDYDGDDSYERIRQDRLDLDELKEAEQSESYRVAHGEEPEPTTESMLAEIRESVART